MIINASSSSAAIRDAAEEVFFGISPFGIMRVAVVDGMISRLDFSDMEHSVADRIGQSIVDRVFLGKVSFDEILLSGTSFQMRVWRTLMQISRGSTITYSQLAARMGIPSAVRAVANAVAANKIAVIVPCHRVVPATGGVGGYRWGSRIKAALIAHERSNL